ncbi:MAG: hypothetical protein NT085_05220 [candidate division SR1 bacterium]|nr:hypothetical protein [candidate division SR1 bacterium]
MKKSILIGMMVCIAGMSRVFANDCNILIDNGEAVQKIDVHIAKLVEAYEYIYGNTAIYTGILPTAAFKQALVNLKSYCCQKIIKQSCTSSDLQNIKQPFPESAFLFDHLVDVAMRRLDGIIGLAYNLSPDSTALERRTKMTDIANSPNGRQAAEIEALYTGYRTIHDGYTTEYIRSQYNKTGVVSLGDKYNKICEFMKNIYDNSTITNKITIGYAYMNGCKNLVKDRVKRENGYTRILMVEKSNQLFTEATKAYTKKHFVEEKLLALWNLITQVKDVFQTIVQQAPVSKTCSK